MLDWAYAGGDMRQSDVSSRLSRMERCVLGGAEGVTRVLVLFLGCNRCVVVIVRECCRRENIYTRRTTQLSGLKMRSVKWRFSGRLLIGWLGV